MICPETPHILPEDLQAIETDMIKMEKIPCLTQKTIECDPKAFNDWLCQVAEQINYNNLYTRLNHYRMKELRQRVECLSTELTNLTSRVNQIDLRVTSNTDEINNIKNRLDTFNDLISTVQNSFSQWVSWLPCGNTGSVPQGWVFAMAPRSALYTGECMDITPRLNSYPDLAQKINNLYNLLPYEISTITQAGHKLAVGNINITSGNADGNDGIFTRTKNQNNDLNFT